MGDTGLLVSHAFDENELLEDEVYKQILAGKLEINEGMLYENAIAQMLVANGHKLYFYTHYNEDKHRNDIGIESGRVTSFTLGIEFEVVGGKNEEDIGYCFSMCTLHNALFVWK